jgi:hypothetical protein
VGTNLERAAVVDTLAVPACLPAGLHHHHRSMVSKEVFEAHFWKCYNAFREKATADIGVPGYFRFITLLGEE